MTFDNPHQICESHSNVFDVNQAGTVCLGMHSVASTRWASAFLLVELNIRRFIGLLRDRAVASASEPFNTMIVPPEIVLQLEGNRICYRSPYSSWRRLGTQR